MSIDWSVLESAVSYSVSVDEHLVYYDTREGFLGERRQTMSTDGWPALVVLEVYERTPLSYVSFYGPTIADVVAQYADYKEEA